MYVEAVLVLNVLSWVLIVFFNTVCQMGHVKLFSSKKLGLDVSNDLELVA